MNELPASAAREGDVTAATQRKVLVALLAYRRQWPKSRIHAAGRDRLELAVSAAHDAGESNEQADEPGFVQTCG
ncbi:MAG: hypothetical protein ACREF3_14595 [Acetobacteraceae bacterium]